MSRKNWKNTISQYPSNWQPVRLKDIGELKNGVNKDKTAYGSGTLFVNIGDAYSTHLDCSKLGRVEVTSSDLNIYSLKKGDIIFVRSSVKPSGVGYNTVFVFHSEPVVYAGFMIRFRLFDKEEFYPYFYNYFFRSEHFRSSIIAASTVSANTNVNQENIGQIVVPKIPIEQQKKITKILTTIDNTITQTEATIAKFEAIKSGMMHDLFTRGIGEDGALRPSVQDAPELYQESELGWLPKEWEVVKIGDIYDDLRTGSTPSRARPEYFTGQILWVTSGELDYNIITNTYEKITEEAVRNTNLRIYPKGTFFIAITGLEAEGTRGRCGIIGKEATTNQSCMAFEEKEVIDTYFLYLYYLHNGEKIAFQYAQGTKQQSFNGSIVKNIFIPLPSKKEQELIAKRLKVFQAKIKTEQEQLSKLQSIKQGLMQDLLTGRVAV